MDPQNPRSSLAKPRDDRGTYRKQLRRQESPRPGRFITFSTYRRAPLLVHPGVAADLAARLHSARSVHGLRVYAWVIMPEHVHLLVRASGAPWSVVARAVKTQVARQGLAAIRDAGRAADRFWQHGGGFDRNVRDMTEFTKAVRYIHRNPVERGLATRPQDWQWSSVRWWMGLREGEFECDPPPGDPEAWKRWKGFV
ncbi:MAG: transposase [Phycisphaerales bacterium]|nr:transposase [Phycisphaerales bacterium]